MIDKFTKGKYYRYVGREPPRNWVGAMLAVMDGQWRMCEGTFLNWIYLQGINTLPWIWDDYKNWEERDGK